MHFSFVSDHVHFTSPITLNISKMVHVFMSPSPLINVICRPSKQIPYTLWILEDSIDVWIFLISMFISFFLNTKRQLEGKCHPMLQGWSFWRAGGQYSPHLKKNSWPSEWRPTNSISLSLFVNDYSWLFICSSRVHVWLSQHLRCCIGLRMVHCRCYK